MKTLLAIFSFISLLILNTTCCYAYNRVNNYQDLLIKINNNQSNLIETFEKDLQRINREEKIYINRNKSKINNINNGGYYIRITHGNWKEDKDEVLLESGYIFEL